MIELTLRKKELTSGKNTSSFKITLCYARLRLRPCACLGLADLENSIESSHDILPQKAEQHLRDERVFFPKSMGLRLRTNRNCSCSFTGDCSFLYLGQCELSPRIHCCHSTQGSEIVASIQIPSTVSCPVTPFLCDLWSCGHQWPLQVTQNRSINQFTYLHIILCDVIP